MNIPKQVIVVRKDLKMPIGKALAQVAHASMAVILNEMEKQGNTWTLYTQDGSALSEWLTGSFTKVVVAIDSEEELLLLHERASAAGIPASKIIDSGRTVFNGVPTLTCCAFGPAYSEELDALTGHLKLLNKL